MLKLSSGTYHLKEIDQKTFWNKLDAITFGQVMNPEMGYTTQYWGNFDNVFAGRRKDDDFSIYLYRPITEGFRTEILAKGTVKSGLQGILVEVNFEVPLWSILAFFFIGGTLFLSLWLSAAAGIAVITSGVLLIIYGLILNANHNSVKREIRKQFKRFQ